MANKDLDKKLDAAAGCLGVITMVLGIVLLGIVLSAYYSLILSYLWFWFVAYPFGVKAITVAQAYGLVLVSHFFLNGVAKRKTEDSGGVIGLIVGELIGSTILWGVGYIVFHTWVQYQ